MNPAILVLSYADKLKPIEIIDELVKQNKEAKTVKHVTFNDQKFCTYPYTNQTKYYTNDLMLIPHEGDVHDLPSELLAVTEGLIVYFDGENKNFVEEISALCKLAEGNNIELRLFVTDELFDDVAAGLTYKQVKTVSNMLYDIIEMKSDADSDNKESYMEIKYAIQNNIWSNVKHPKLLNTQENELEQGWDNMEEQLELFEELLASLQNFKKISSSLEREEVLNQAEKFAEVFTNIINDDRD